MLFWLGLVSVVHNSRRKIIRPSVAVVLGVGVHNYRLITRDWLTVVEVEVVVLKYLIYTQPTTFSVCLFHSLVVVVVVAVVDVTLCLVFDASQSKQHTHTQVIRKKEKKTDWLAD